MATEISKQLDRIESAVSDIKAAIVKRGVQVPSETKIGGLASLVSSISPPVNLQSKYVIPEDLAKTITADDGYDGLSSVIVGAIPADRVNTSSGNALAGEILYSKKAWVDGKEVTGTMPVRSPENVILDATKTSHTVSYGYHSVDSSVSIVLDTKEVTPTESSQTVTPTAGKVLSAVTVNPIPAKYKDTTGANALPSQVVAGSKFVGANGVVEEGTMPTIGLLAPVFTVEADDEEGELAIKASVTQSEGYTKGGNTFNVAYPKLTISGDTATMRCGNAEVTRQVFDPNLIAANIKKGVTIFGIVGTYEGGGEVVLPSIDVRIIDNDWCGPYGITYTNSSGGQVTQTVACGGDITITALSGTIVHISADSSSGYGGAVLEDESGTRVDTCSWNEYEIQLPSDGESYMLYIFG